MPNYARAITGSVIGIVGIAADTTPFHCKAGRFKIVVVQDLSDVSGYGDGGNTYRSPGKSDWTGGVGGFVLTGSTGTVGINNIQGTNMVLCAGTLLASNGRTMSGSCWVGQVEIVSDYKNGGDVPVSFNIFAEGPLTES